MAKNKTGLGLGKGLDALLTTNIDQLDQSAAAEATADDGTSNDIVALIELGRVQPNPFQPRADFDETALEELKNSIRENGIIQPITVRRAGDRYEIIAGERRYRASLELGRTSIPAYILAVDTDAEMLELALIENVQREHLNPVEVALGYERLISECNLTQEEVARKVGKDRTTVANFLRLLKLPQTALDGLRAKSLTTGHARALLAIGDEETQLRAYGRVLEENLSVRQTESLVEKIRKGLPVDTPLDIVPRTNKTRNRTPKSAENNGATQLPPQVEATLTEIEERLRHLLATKVRLRAKGGGNGSIEIEFYTMEELERLLDMFAIIERGG